jgi:dTDP-4-amino-4,6-dideoxygalactose transaminase
VGIVDITSKVKKNIFAVLKKGRLSQGKYVVKFENKLKRWLDISNCVAVSSGTMALTLALCALKEKYKYDNKTEVILPALTFISTANAILEAGLVPKFVDTDANAYQIDPEKVKKAITRKTKVIIPVHLFGKPAPMDRILSLSTKFGLKIVEDAAQALGAESKRRKIGTFGKCGIFSFYTAHIITTAEGGAIVTRDEKIVSILRSLRAHGRICNCQECILNVSSSYCPLRFKYKNIFDARFSFERVGFSAKMNELEAVLGLEQIERLNSILSKRRENFFYISKKLNKLKNYFQFLDEEENEKISPLVFPILIKRKSHIRRKDLVKFLEESGIETRPAFSSLPTQQSAFKFLGYKKGMFKNAEYVGRNGFYIGVHQKFKKEDLDYIAYKIEEFIKR